MNIAYFAETHRMSSIWIWVFGLMTLFSIFVILMHRKIWVIEKSSSLFLSLFSVLIGSFFLFSMVNQFNVRADNISTLVEKVSKDKSIIITEELAKEIITNRNEELKEARIRSLDDSSDRFYNIYYQSYKGNLNFYIEKESDIYVPIN